MMWYLLVWLLMLLIVVLGVLGSILIALPLYRQRMHQLRRRPQTTNLHSMLFESGKWDLW